MNELEIRPMLPGDAVLLKMQPSQHFEFGVEHRQFTFEEGEQLAFGGVAWTACRGIEIIGIAGFRECYPGHATLWAALSAKIGPDHLACTRFARREIEASPYRRLEAVVELDNERACAWAKLVGLVPVHVMHGYGAAGRPHVLFERVRMQ